MTHAFSVLFFYLFWPNPANATYGNPKVMALIVACALLIVASLTISLWRRSVGNAILKKLSRTWALAAFWFGLTGLVFVVARVEQIQFVSMRIWWVLWAAIAILYVFLQMKLFRARYYAVLPSEREDDPRGKYLPRRKKN